MPIEIPALNARVDDVTERVRMRSVADRADYLGRTKAAGPPGSAREGPAARRRTPKPAH